MTGVKTLMNFNATTTLYKGIISKQGTINIIPNKLQKRYHSGIGSLIYLIRHS